MIRCLTIFLTTFFEYQYYFQYEAYSIERNAERVQESAKLFYHM